VLCRADLLPMCFGCLSQKVDRRQEAPGGGGSKRERCFGVEAYWRQLDPHQRRRLMRAPLSKMLEGEAADCVADEHQACFADVQRA
jgi:hypothetical protein